MRRDSGPFSSSVSGNFNSNGKINYRKFTERMNFLNENADRNEESAFCQAGPRPDAP